MKDIDILFESLMPLADNNLIDINDINENTTAIIILQKEHQIMSINKNIPQKIFDIIKESGYDIISDKKFNNLYIYSVINNPYKIYE